MICARQTADQMPVPVLLFFSDFLGAQRTHAGYGASFWKQNENGPSAEPRKNNGRHFGNFQTGRGGGWFNPDTVLGRESIEHLRQWWF